MIAPGDLKLFRLTDDTDQVVGWIEESFADEAEARAEPPRRTPSTEKVEARSRNARAPNGPTMPE